MRKLMVSAFVVISVIAWTQEKIQWEGSVKVVEGVKIIMNPENPMYPGNIFNLEEELSIESNNTNSQEMFQTIVSLAVDDKGNIFVLDKKAADIKVFDKDGRFMKTIGRRGQGPGEFGAPESSAITKENELYVYDSVRMAVLHFDATGEFKRTLPVKFPFFEGPKVTTKGEIIVSHGVLGEKTVFELKKFDSEMNPILTFSTIPIERPPKVHVFVYYTASDLKWDVSPRGEIVWGVMTTPEYELFIHDEDGKQIRKIKKKFTPIRLSKEEYKKLMKKWFGRIPAAGKWDLIIPSHYPPFQGFFIDDEGRILVKRFVEVERDDRHFFDVFDEEGRFIACITLDTKFRFGVFKNKRLYSIEMDDEGNQRVTCYKTIWNY